MLAEAPYFLRAFLHKTPPSSFIFRCKLAISLRQLSSPLPLISLLAAATSQSPINSRAAIALLARGCRRRLLVVRPRISSMLSSSTAKRYCTRAKNRKGRKRKTNWAL